MKVIRIEISGAVLNGDTAASYSAGFIVEDHRRTDDGIAIVDHHAGPSTGVDNRCSLPYNSWNYNGGPRVCLE